MEVMGDWVIAILLLALKCLQNYFHLTQSTTYRKSLMLQLDLLVERFHNGVNI